MQDRLPEDYLIRHFEMHILSISPPERAKNNNILAACEICIHKIFEISEPS